MWVFVKFNLVEGVVLGNFPIAPFFLHMMSIFHGLYPSTDGYLSKYPSDCLFVCFRPWLML